MLLVPRGSAGRTGTSGLEEELTANWANLSADNWRQGAPGRTHAHSSCWDLLKDTNQVWIASWKESSWRVHMTEVPMRGGRDARYLSFSSEKGPCGEWADVPVLSVHLFLFLPSSYIPCNKKHSVKIKLFKLPSASFKTLHKLFLISTITF